MEAITTIWLFIAYTALFVLLAACWFCGCFDGSKCRQISRILNILVGSIKRTIPHKLSESIDKVFIYTFYKRNPIFQIVYASLLFIGYAVYTVTAFPYVSESYTGRMPYYLLIINLILFAVCCCTDPGIITRTNVDKRLLDFEYDGTMYSPRDCSTCNIKKPARSKHCSMCNMCIARFDHHCSFLNICVGKYNYRYFVALLASLVLMCAIASFIIVMVFIHIVDANGLHTTQYTDQYGVIYEASLHTVLQYLAISYPLMALLLLSLVCLFLALSCFFLFHCYLVLVNKTTNEFLSKSKSSQQDGTVRNAQTYWGIFGLYSRGILYNIFEVLLP